MDLWLHKRGYDSSRRRPAVEERGSVDFGTPDQETD